MRRTDEEFVSEIYKRCNKRRTARLQYIKFAPLVAACLLVCIGLGALKLYNTRINKEKLGIVTVKNDEKAYGASKENIAGNPISSVIITDGQLSGVQSVSNITVEYLGKQYEITDETFVTWLDGIEKNEPTTLSDKKLLLKVFYAGRKFTFYDSDGDYEAAVLVDGKYYTADKEMILKIISKLN